VLTRSIAGLLPEAKVTATELNAAMVEVGSANVPTVSVQQLGPTRQQ